MFGFFKKRITEVREQQNLIFRQKYLNFKELLDRNNEVLEALSTLAEIRDQREWISLGRLRAMITRIAVNVYRLIQNLNFITDDKYQNLTDIFARLEEGIVKSLERPIIPQLEVYTVPLEEVSRELSEEVGVKGATLGEIKKRLDIEIPQGLAVTAFSYKSFFEHNRLQDQINKESLSIDRNDLKSIDQFSQRVQELIMAASLPSELDDSLQSAYRHLEEKVGTHIPVVLRSSAVGEDELGASFAGLYRSIINPRPEDLGKTYKEVIASKYSPRAITYRLQKGIYEELTPMCALLMELVTASAGGVMYSQDPNTQNEELLINAVWGLGKLAVDGTLIPDRFRVKRSGTLEIIGKEIGKKNTRLEAAEGGGVRTVEIEKNRIAQACLSDKQILKLAGIGLQLEAVFDSPQDVEWVIDASERIYVVQSRPLKMEVSSQSWSDLYPKEDLTRTNRLLCSGLQVASAGVAHGRAAPLSRISEMGQFQKGAILVVKNTVPDLVSLLPRASAVVAEKGSTTGHLAIIAREFHVPMLIGLPPQITEKISEEGEITVDAFTGSLFRGKVEALLTMASTLRDTVEEVIPTPTQHLLDEVLQYVTPLNLIDPRDPSFRSQSIATIHDMIRFAHEKSINAMFDINDSRFLRKGHVKKLRSHVPLNIHLIDIGTGLRDGGDKREVSPEEIISIPMLALYRGMTTEGVRWAGHIPIDFKGFISVFANTLYDASKHERRLGDRSYAIISRRYMNFSSRLGYHFSIVDAYVGPVANDNYISFRFKGGAASIEKRTRRVRFIREVLERQGFWVDQKEDLINARVKRLPQADIEKKLVMLGRLMGCSRQLDVTMHSEGMVDRYVELFMKGDYSMGYEAEEATGTQ